MIVSARANRSDELRPALWASLIFLTIISIVRIFVLYATPMHLFFDEAQYWFWGTTLDFGYFSKPPLLAWIIRAFTELCGTGEACIRMASPVIYALTALTGGLLAARIAPRLGGSASAAFFWTVILLVTLPGISFGARLVSTDAPLLLCFALALLFLDRFQEHPTSLKAALLGLAIGAGFLAKYAMVYFLLCALIWLIFSREARQTLFKPQLFITLLVALFTISPNLWWNAANGWITFQHTGENADWQGWNFQFDNLAEFIGAQIGILGPVLFLVLVIGLWKSKRALPPCVIYLLCFSLPVILLMSVQATISRAHANWAAVAFIGLSVLTVSWAVSWRAKPLLVGALAVQIVVLFVLAGADIFADRLVGERVGAAYKRVFGWREFASAVANQARDHDVKTILADRRNTVAQLTYYLRNEDFEIRSWPPTGAPRHFYEMAVPLEPRDQAPVLFVTFCRPSPKSTKIDIMPPIAISVRANYAVSGHISLSQTASLTRQDVC